MYITPENSIEELTYECPRGIYIRVHRYCSMWYYDVLEYKGAYWEVGDERLPDYEKIETFHDHKLPAKYKDATIIFDEFQEYPTFGD